MATESPMKMVESNKGTKGLSSKDAATFGSPLQSMAAEELDFVMKEQILHGHQAPNRSGSAPPSMEGSFAAVRNLLLEQNVSVNSSLDDLKKNALENFEPNEQQQSDPDYLAYYSNLELKENRRLVRNISSFRNNRRSTSMDDSGNGFLHFSQGSLSTHKEETEEESSSVKDSETLVENSAAELPGKSTSGLPSRHKSLVDLIQEDFPRTPSPVYNQSRSSSHATTGELINVDMHSISLNISSVDKTPESNSGSINSSDAPSTNFFPSSWHPDKTRTPHKDVSNNNSEDNAPISSAIRTNTSRLEVKKKQEKQQSYGGNIPKFQLSRREGMPQVHHGYSPTISQGMNYLESSMEKISHVHPNFSSIEVEQAFHAPGFMPPFYATSAGYMASGNMSFYPNPQPSGLYAPQYGLPGYALGSTLLPPFMAAYPSHNTLPLLFGATSGPSFSGRIPGVSMGEGILHGGDVQQQSKFYRQHEPISQPSFVNPLPMQYYPNPPHDIYGSSVQHGQLPSRGILRSQFTQQPSTFSAYVGDHKFQSLTNESVSISSPRKMGNGGYGNPPSMSGMTHFPSSPLVSPLIPPSPIGGANNPGRQIEMRFPQGQIRNLGIYSGLQGKGGSDATGDLNKLSLLEELKSSNSKRLELSDIEGHIVEFSIDQHGSRFIQQKLEHCSAEEKESVFKEVLPHASRLMTDVFGNYVIQKYFEHGSSEQRKELANQLCGQMLPLSLQMYGCRVIQKALEVIELDQKKFLVKELDGHVMECVRDQNGNHVIQKCIECVPPEKNRFIMLSFQGEVATLATHPYGCRVIQRVLERFSDNLQCQGIVDEILESCCVLAQDQYGNYVIQHVLERGKPHQRSQIISKLAGRIVQMSQHKYASNVVEKCLEHGNSTEQELLIEEILGQSEENDYLLIMMKDQFANYVVQKIFEKSNDRQREILLDRTRTHLHALRKYTYGKHIVARFELLAGEEDQARVSEGA